MSVLLLNVLWLPFNLTCRLEFSKNGQFDNGHLILKSTSTGHTVTRSETIEETNDPWDDKNVL